MREGWGKVERERRAEVLGEEGESYEEKRELRFTVELLYKQMLCYINGSDKFKSLLSRRLISITVL